MEPWIALKRGWWQKGIHRNMALTTLDTFALVAKINTVRVLLSLVANLDWPLQQFDVKKAFLHGDLTEAIYIDLPPGCNDPHIRKRKVCRPRNSLYWLKKSLRAWFGKYMRARVYQQSNWDHTLFLKCKNGKITTLIVYVDDMVVLVMIQLSKPLCKNICPQNLKWKILVL